MRHYHEKKDLADHDVFYTVVEQGQQFSFSFDKVRASIDDGTDIFQGIKFWMNRCKIEIGNKKIETDRLIIWHDKSNGKPGVSNGHFHYFLDGVITFKIIETVEENPNIGIFNVWTIDNKRCYEFTGSSSIEGIKRGNKTTFKARHGWAKSEKPTVEFSLISVNLSI